MRMLDEMARHCRNTTPGRALWTMCGLKSAGRTVLSPAVFSASEADMRCYACDHLYALIKWQRANRNRNLHR